MNLMVRRELFQAIHGFNERLLTAEDVDLCYRLETYGRIVSVHRCKQFIGAKRLI